MLAAISATFSRARTVLLFLALVFITGGYSYLSIPKEAAPEIDIPLFIVTVAYPGISAEDSARLLVEPMERQLQSIAGLDQLTAQAGEGFATLTLEFDPGFDHEQALQSVREETDNAAPDLPEGAETPVVTEVDLSLFPILTVALSGAVPERELINTARNLQDRLEMLPGVLQATLAGEREDLLEIIIDPLAIQSYGISFQEINEAVSNNNQLVPAGAFDTGAGRIAVSVPGTIQSIADVLAMPVRVAESTVVRVADVAQVRQTFQDPDSFARLNGQPTIGIDIRKNSGANIIDTVDRVRTEVEAARRDWPDTLRVDYLQNQAEDIDDLLGDLENNVIAAVVLVLLTMILALGTRAALLVAIAIPGSFLGGILLINLSGYTLNIVVLFGLILVVGMLVDGAIVVVELAERLQAEGAAPHEAFLRAAQRMAWPITASTATTVAVFLPLLFWPGTAGQFMRYLPATVIVTLLMSLAMALIFVPVIGALVGRHRQGSGSRLATRPPGPYDRALRRVIARPGLTLGCSILALLAAFMLYGALGRGLIFFPAVDAERAQIQIQAYGNYSVREADRLVRQVEERVYGTPGVEYLYARTIGSVEGRLRANLGPDTIGTLQLDFADWRQRPSSDAIITELRERTADLPLDMRIEEAQSGPGESRPVQVEISADDRALLPEAAAQLQELMRQQGSFVDIGSDVPVPSAAIELRVEREQAARYGVDINTLGSAVQLLTNGILLGSFLPSYAPDEVDIRLRYPINDRTFAQLADLRVPSAKGQVPIANFVTLVPAPASAVINRVDARNVQTLSAGLVPGATVAEELARLAQSIAAADFPAGVSLSFAGEIEDLEDSLSFLSLAFFLAIFLMFLVLLTQLNSFFQAFLVLSAIVFSLAGVMLGLILRQEPFSVVMSGIGVVALAGIVVNNNIVLIDAYNEHVGNGLSPTEAALRAGSERFRPVLLTAITTIVGLLPMVLGLTVDFIERGIYFGAPSGQFWIQLSTAIVGGLLTATFITILLTPALLAWQGEHQASRASDS